ncbi:hypothetical protein INS49_014307 [Diaporthe citri]|uniref:uncharacterized protein n=1 Tax=Diaporthe citri TaxID=83186 RepID=UPI001C80D217|nr:uncharacterized protein INS49_014307 [Diaporthe citri]KAG6358423.1 hypothetical protein INS49_014307 [Diaporthe citri]
MWLVQCDKYAAWKTEENSFIWLYGIPGCGKTILSSTVIEDLGRSEPSSLSFLYHYFDFSNVRKQSRENAVRSLISQLYDKKPNVREHLDSLHTSCHSGNQQPSDQALRRAFQSMIQDTGEIWIVLDALDECQNRNEYSDLSLLEWFEFLQGEQGNVHLLVTSRPEQDIESAIDRYRGSIKHSISIQSDLVKGDIKAYIRARLIGNSELRRWRSNIPVQNEIEAVLIEKADGMFRWVQCQLDDLEHRFTRRSVRTALASLPRTLDDTYARILQNIPEDYREHTKRMLQFLTYSEHPMTFRELVDALAVEVEPRRSFDPTDRMPDPAEVTRYCSSLVMVISGDKLPFSIRFPMSSRLSTSTYTRSIEWDTDDFWENEIQLSHFSVREYLTSERLPEYLAKDLENIAARAAIVQVSLAYLLGIDHNRSRRKIARKFPFADYAARYWASQAAMVEAFSQETRRLIQ